MIHDANGTGSNTDSLVVAIAGHTGYIGKIVMNQLSNRGIQFYKIPSFRDLSSEEIDGEIAKGRVVLINCAGRTLRHDQDIRHDIYEDNVRSLEKLIFAFANRMHSVLHMSTAHLNSPELDNEYTRAKKESEEHLNQMALKYSFEGVNFRLPTIWSSEYLKAKSLLDDITSINLEESINLVRSPKATVQIAPEKSLGVQIELFLKGERRRVAYDDLDSWTGNVTQLINLIKSGEAASSSIENELQRIYKSWKLQKFNP